MTNFTNFTEQLKKELQKIYSDAQISTSKVEKQNDVILTGLTIRLPGQRIVPTIYLEPYYEDYATGKSLNEIVENIASVNNSNQKMDIPDFDFKSVKSSLKCALVNTQRSAIYLSKIPYLSFLDFSIVFYWNVSVPVDGLATITVTNALFEKWGVDQQELMRIALSNMKNDILICSMADVLHDFLNETGNDNLEQEQMFILTNHDKLRGASLILCNDCLEKISNVMNGDFIIIPSSIHEVLILPFHSQNDVEELKAMVADVNDKYVAENEILSYNVYHYSAQDKRIYIM